MMASSIGNHFLCLSTGEGGGEGGGGGGGGGGMNDNNIETPFLI